MGSTKPVMVCKKRFYLLAFFNTFSGSRCYQKYITRLCCVFSRFFSNHTNPLVSLSWHYINKQSLYFQNIQNTLSLQIMHPFNEKRINSSKRRSHNSAWLYCTETGSFKVTGCQRLGYREIDWQTQMDFTWSSVI